ncbi:MAG: 3-dehydroquinate dehydratase [Bacteroidia bacterium]|nr:MAG: 3-dehydroquinate dehydratase [Bacteroidia bacterium]
MKRIGILNGPNLNKLGEREHELYGLVSFEEFLNQLQSKYLDIELCYYQSNTEGFLIDKLQEWKDTMNGIVINAGAYTHTSIAIADCLAYIKIPVVEVHITNIYAREHYRQHSYLSKYCKAVIAGMGLKGYEVAVDYLKTIIKYCD